MRSGSPSGLFGHWPFTTLFLKKIMSTKFDQAKQSARKWLRRSLWAGIVGLFLFSAGYYIYRTYTISEGSRSGTLFKISKKGVVFKTYEGQLHLAGSVMMTEQSTWNFSAKNSAVYEQLQPLEGKTVRCYYRQKVNAFPWQGDTDYIVYKAEAIE